VVANVQSRAQWPDDDAYCGSLSIQAIAMNYGNWISQDRVRKAAPPSTLHNCSTGEPAHGYEIDTSNIEPALKKLGLAYDTWGGEKHSTPQYTKYLNWMKRHLVKRQPVIWFIMTKGSSHSDSCQGWDHIEPVWGIFSNNSLSSGVVFGDDVVVHGANFEYGANATTEGAKLYRKFSSLPDSQKMDGNCAEAEPGVGKNEYYPCVASTTTDFGLSILGNIDESQGNNAVELADYSNSHANASKTNRDHLQTDRRDNVQVVPLWLDVGRFDEPRLRSGARPVMLRATLTINSDTLVQVGGGSFVIYRWDGEYASVVPSHPLMYANSSETTSRHKFEIQGGRNGSYVYHDPLVVWSNGTTYYRAAKAV
jgi:hypothetical protein